MLRVSLPCSCVPVLLSKLVCKEGFTTNFAVMVQPLHIISLKKELNFFLANVSKRRQLEVL